MRRSHPRSAQDFDQEIQAHILLDTDRFIADGLTPEDAKAAALRAFGNVTRAQEGFYESQRVMWLDDLKRDASYAIRTLRRNPGFATVAVLTLALTLGVGTALFALVDAVVLTPPPYAEPESLVVLGEVPIESVGASPRPVRWTTFEQWREYRHLFTQIEAFDPINMTLTGRGAAERVSGVAVTAGFFRLLGVSPMLGRTWTEAEAETDVAVVSAGFWRAKLGSDSHVLGSEIVLGARRFTVVGVLPKQFRFEMRDVWMPRPRYADDGPPVQVLARLAPGNTAARAAQALDEVSNRSSPPARVIALPLTGVIVGTLGRILVLLLLGVSVAISLAVINVTSLLVVRTIARHREFAIRRALGAGAARLAKQLLIETHVLVVTGAVAGILLALWITPLAGRLAGEQFRSVATSDLTVRWRTVTALAGAAWLCAWACGLTVAARGVRANGSDLLLRSASAGPRELALRRVLTAAEIALAFVLLVSLAVVGRSLQRTFAINPGFDAAHVLTAGLSLPRARYPDAPDVAAFYQNLDQVLSERLGRANVAIVDELPLTGDSGHSAVGAHQGQADRDAVVRAAGPGYFEAMRIPVLDGRGFGAQDDQAAPSRAVISQLLAREIFGESRSVGRQIWVASLKQMAEVVGVVGDVKHRALDEPTLATLYLSAWQQPSPSSRIVIRESDGGSRGLAVLRGEVGRLDRELPVYGVQAMEDIVQASPGIPTRRVLAMCFLAYAALAVVIAGLGIFGMVTHDLTRRRFEFALRLALGANAMQLQGSIVRRAAAFVAAGLIPGVVLAVVASRMLRSVVADVDAMDPVAFAAVAAVLFIVVGIAIGAPTRRVARIDPALVLRSD